MKIKSGIRYWYVAVVLFFCIHFRAEAKNYYFSSGGNNSHTGLSATDPWQSVAMLNNVVLRPGDSVLFRGGDTLSGIIYAAPADSGTAAQPIVFTSYGTGTATINAGYGTGFYAYNTGGIEVNNLNFFGSGISSNTGSGISFYTDRNDGHKFKHISINNSSITGFGDCGILIGSYDKSYPGFQDIRITHVTVTNVNKKGIFTFDINGAGSGLYAHKNMYVAYCTLLQNGVEGMVLSGMDSGLVEYCRASYTGYYSNTGDCGIWAYEANNITFQHCISDHNTTSGSDGEGFDLDGGTQNCVIQYCYAFQNAACGFMHCDYPGSRPTKNNIIRYCISENDGRKAADNGCGFLFTSWGTGIDSCYMYNNTSFISDNGAHPVSAFRGYVLHGYDVNPHISRCVAVNNIMQVDGINTNALFSYEDGTATLSDTGILLLGNCYYTAHAGSARWILGAHTYTSLKNMQDSAGQEMLGGARKGYTINPSLTSPGNGGTVAYPDSLTHLVAYKLKSRSSLIGRGLNIDQLLPVKNAFYDFYGDTLTPYHQYTPGAHEPQPDKYPHAGFGVARFCLGYSTLFTDSSKLAVAFHWDFGDGDTSDLVSPAHYYVKAGKYTVVQVVRSMYGINDTLTKSIEIFQPPVARFSAGNICRYQALSVSDSSLNADSFAWDFGDSTASGLQNPDHTYSHAGLHSVSLIAISANGCADTDTRAVVSLPTPRAAYGYKDICLGDSMSFFDLSRLSARRAWYFGDGSISADSSPRHLYHLPGAYKVSLIVYSDQGCSDSVSHTVQVFARSDATFSAVQRVGDTYVFQAHDSLLVDYRWDFGDSTTASGAYLQQHVFEGSGRYRVLLQVRNGNGCTAESYDSLTITKTGMFSHADTAGKISLAPNPCIENTWLNYTLTRPGVVNISLYDISGACIAHLLGNLQPAGNYSMDIKCSAYPLSPGIYFLKWQTADQIRIIKLVKE